LLEAGTYGLINMAISEKKILEIWRGWCFFFHKNPLYELHWLYFFGSPLVPGKKTKRKKKRKEIIIKICCPEILLILFKGI
jgi:hypothetical protein